MFRDFLTPYAFHFRGMGWEVDAMAQDISQSSDKIYYDQVWDVKWSRNPFAISNVFHAPATVRRVVDHRQYDLIHVHTPIPAFVCRYAVRDCREASGPKIIYTAHGFHFHPNGSIFKNRVFLTAEQVAGRWTDYLVVINRHDEECARVHNIVASEQIVCMPGIGLKIAQYSPEAVPTAEIVRIRQELGLRADEVIVLMVAEFAPGKRHSDAVNAFAKVSSPKIHLVFAGEGPLLPAIRRMVKAAGLERRVHLLGFRRDIPALLRSSAMLILPSEREGLPKSVMEALCMGVPVIGTDVRGIRDLLADGAGMLVPLGDTSQMAKSIDWVLENPDEAAIMTGRGRSNVCQYDLQNVLALHEQLYERALSAASAARC